MGVRLLPFRLYHFGLFEMRTLTGWATMGL